MEHLKELEMWLESHRDLALDLLRIYLGVGLFVKGAYFIGQTNDLMQTMESSHVPFASVALAHYVILAHIGGGLLLAMGLLTRWAALFQLPVLFGAVFFVHMEQGLFTQSQGLEFSGLVLFLLLVFSVCGAGRLSVDYYLRDLTLARDVTA